jgi:CPA2 family monovalent cation:H+ antiporter-2
MSLAQIGEFSFIIAAVGLSSGATREFLYPVAIAVSAITTLTTPWLIRSASPVAAWVDSKLPHPVQTFTALYGSWIERVRSTPAEPKKRSRALRLTGLLLLDAALIAVVVIAAAAEIGRFTALLRDWTGARDEIARIIVIAGAVVVAIPLIIGLLRGARLLGLELALRAMPEAKQGKVDIADAPRRALVVTLQLAIILAVTLPLLALTQPFVPNFRLETVMALLLVILGIAFWRSATNLQGHARAGAEVIAAALGRQMSNSEALPDALTQTMEQVHTFLPGLGEPTPLRVWPGCHAAGRTLAELNLRGLSGATVLAILRKGEEVLAPMGKEVLRDGDVLAVAGSKDSINAARIIIDSGEPAT